MPIQYFDDILNTSITDNPKKFYSYIKQKKSGQSNIPVLKRNTEILSEPKDKANVLSDQYTSVFTREPHGQLPDIDGAHIPPMTDNKFTSPGVETLLQKQGSWLGSLANSYAQEGSKGNSPSISFYLPAVVLYQSSPIRLAVCKCHRSI